MAGKLEKMLILAFKDSKEAESGGKDQADAFFETLINPESYTLDYKLKFSESQGQGTSGKQLKYEYTEPEEITFEFLFDNTGIIDGKPRPDVAEDLQRFREVLIDYKGDAHEPRHFKLVWGAGLSNKGIFKGRVTEVSITYKLFSPDGKPLRAVAKVKFKASIEEMKRAAKENKQSPDLTHLRTVKAGDTLPLLCYRIYGDSKYYLQVARINQLSNFRRLIPGQQLVFPPIEKTPQTPSK
ncbi:CIS tube protein [Runella sp.]|uniref:CIS tube protein n=1 Tax=Runella sp. TaxID=1960881 RepID=UPI003D0AAC1F